MRASKKTTVWCWGGVCALEKGVFALEAGKDNCAVLFYEGECALEWDVTGRFLEEDDRAVIGGRICV